MSVIRRISESGRTSPRSEKGPGGDIAPDEAQNGERLLTKALKMSGPHKERNRTERIGWLRAAVLGANDGIVSTASLVLGVAAAHGTRSNVLVAGVPVWSQGQWRWLPVSTCLSTHRLTPNTPTKCESGLRV